MVSPMLQPFHFHSSVIVRPSSPPPRALTLNFVNSAAVKSSLNFAQRTPMIVSSLNSVPPKEVPKQIEGEIGLNNLYRSLGLGALVVTVLALFMTRRQQPLPAESRWLKFKNLISHIEALDSKYREKPLLYSVLGLIYLLSAGFGYVAVIGFLHVVWCDLVKHLARSNRKLLREIIIHRHETNFLLEEIKLMRRDIESVKKNG